MSKAFALAGARVGYLAADPDLVDALRLVRMPYHLSDPTQAVALAAIRHDASLLATVEAIKAQRDRIVAELDGLGYPPVPSDANFVLYGGLADAHATGRRCSTGASWSATSASRTTSGSPRARRRSRRRSCGRWPICQTRTGSTHATRGGEGMTAHTGEPA